MAAETAAETLRLSPLGPSKKSKKRTNTSNTRLIVGLSVVTGAAVLVLVLVVLLWPSEGQCRACQGGDNTRYEALRVRRGVPFAVPSTGASQTRGSAYVSVFPGRGDRSAGVERREAAFRPGRVPQGPARRGKRRAVVSGCPVRVRVQNCRSAIVCPGKDPQGETKRRVEIARQRYQEYARLDEARRERPGICRQGRRGRLVGPVRRWVSEAGGSTAAPAVRLPDGPELRLASCPTPTWPVRSPGSSCGEPDEISSGEISERPIQDLETVLRLSRDLRSRGVEVSQLVSIAVDGIMLPANGA